MFPQILKLDLKCQVHFLKNPHRRQNTMLHNVYKSVCCQILQLIILLLGNYKHFHLSEIPNGMFPWWFAVAYLHCRAGRTWESRGLRWLLKDEERLDHGWAGPTGWELGSRAGTGARALPRNLAGDPSPPARFCTRGRTPELGAGGLDLEILLHIS